MTPILRKPAALVVLAAVAGAVALSPAPVAVRTAFGLPLALLLPGLALVDALFPSRAGAVERLAASVALSLATCVVTGFALHWTPFGLRAESWVLVLVGVTGVAAATGSRRLARDPGLQRRVIWPRLPLPSILVVLLALVVAAAAVGLARTPLPADHVRGYTVLSLLPVAPGSQTAVRLEVASSELRETDYRLELRVGEQLLAVRYLSLGPTEDWRAHVDLASVPPARRTVEALLYRAGEGQAYRRATLVLPGSRLPARTAVWLLWIDPRTVRVQVTSAETETTPFRLDLYASGRLERVARLTLAPGERWQGIVDVSSVPLERRSFLEARLYRQGEDDPERFYRRTTLVPPGGGLLEVFGESP